jgi:DNA-binding MarR family transcriptional regulator
MAESNGFNLMQEVVDELRAMGGDLAHLEEGISERSRLHRTDMRCMDVLYRLAPLTAGDLAVATGLSAAATTSLIDRMERAGYAGRTMDPRDRRRVVVRPTELGRAQGAAMWSGLVEGVLHALTSYSTEELVLLRDFVRRIRTVMRSEATAQRGVEDRCCR